MSEKKIKINIRLLALLLGVSIVVSPISAHGVTLSELQKQAEQYRKDITNKKQETTKKKQDAQLLNKAITQISSEINQTQSKINETSSKISQAKDSIVGTEKQIRDKEEELAYQQNLQAEALRTLYVYGDEDLIELLFTEKSFSAVIDQNNYLEALETKIEGTISQIISLKADLENEKKDLESQKSGLELFKSQQESSKKSLDSQKSQQNSLLNSTNSQIQNYLSDITEMQKKVAEIQRQIDILIATSSWGGDIISANDSSWYYRQLDYNVKMGVSPYTIAQYGCLVSSISMVATYYGHRITPADMANDDNLFDSGGYFLQKYPDYLGVYSLGSSAVNWSVLNDDISNGYPVIISLYLPSVGALNRDGSSHFVVVKGFANGKYLMHDPIGNGRGYSIGQVRSMIRLRPN